MRTSWHKLFCAGKSLHSRLPSFRSIFEKFVTWEPQYYHWHCGHRACFMMMLNGMVSLTPGLDTFGQTRQNPRCQRLLSLQPLFLALTLAGPCPDGHLERHALPP